MVKSVHVVLAVVFVVLVNIYYLEDGTEEEEVVVDGGGGRKVEIDNTSIVMRLEEVFRAPF